MIKQISTTLVIVLSIVFALPTLAQDSKTILDKLSQKAQTFKTVYAEYSYSINDVKNDDVMEQNGKVWINDSKFRIELPDYTLISDGETIWTYEKEGNMCTIDYLEDTQAGGMEPSELFTIWESGFKHEWKKTESVDGVSTEVIYLYPKEPKEKPYHTIQLYVDTKANEMKKVVAKGKDGLDTIYVLSAFDPAASVSDSKFSFNTAEFPGVEMQDNRL